MPRADAQQVVVDIQRVVVLQNRHLQLRTIRKHNHRLHCVYVCVCVCVSACVCVCANKYRSLMSMKRFEF